MKKTHEDEGHDAGKTEWKVVGSKKLEEGPMKVSGAETKHNQARWKEILDRIREKKKNRARTT